MANEKFKDTLLSVLKADERLWQDGEFNQTRLFDLVDKHDAILLKLLLDNNELKEKFFVKVNDIFIFKGQDFKFFLDENKLDNSYTQFENIIGLKVGGKMLKDRDEVVLNFPFKDCVLQGGQSRDEGTDIAYEYNEKLDDYVEMEVKRKEVFFNEILAKDEIDRLEAPKVLKNWKRYTKDGEVAVGNLQRDEDGIIQENLIIKGNNLLALHSIKKEFAGKVKLIYIDPPYNTGSDSFKYNDNFNHSTWLTFMKNRLEVAKDLLRDDGVIFVQCDDNEQAYLKVLMDGIFQDGFVNCISVKMSETSGNKMAHSQMRLPKIKEYILLYKNITINLNKIKTDKIEWDSEYSYLLENFSLSDKRKIDEIIEKKNNTVDDIKLIDDLLKNIKIITVNEKQKELGIKDDINWRIDNAYRIIRTAASSSVKGLADTKRQICNQPFFSVLSKRDKIPYIVKGDYAGDAKSPRVQVLFAEDYLQTGLCDLWYDINTTGLELEGEVALKGGKKPEHLIKRVIELATEKDDLVLDFHLGSGTTAAVAHKMNRKYIGIEQIDSQIDLAIERMRNVVDGDQTGISKLLDWQGGGEFVYFELAEWNEEAKQKIQNAKSIEELESLFDTMYEGYFLNYNVKVKEFKEKVLTDSKFRSLPLARQKDMFIRMLDLNQMYVNYTERNDKKFGISGDDISLSEEFYKN